MAEHHEHVDLVAINDLVPADNLAYLLKYDSVHRSPKFSIRAEGDFLVTNKQKTKVCSEKDPTNLPWRE
ncbi:MAG TPA: type I glyceraldehyde-3-phosphate dehydrogenase, partial [Parachlamydiales bacterium]|nr:type I glyceraldehyde-3-phosphate dehydrogenase [Parachlamydiales bacterium]